MSARFWRTAPWQRLTLSSVLGLAAAVVVVVLQRGHPSALSDFSQVWAAARGYLNGLPPYDVVGPGRTFQWNFPLFYPFTAVVFSIPLAPLPIRIVDPLFVGGGTFLLAWALTRDRLANPQLLVFGSLGYLYVLVTSQWSPLLTAGALLPWIGFVLACKPTIGLALWTAYPRLRSAIGCCALVALSFLLRPTWLHEWTATLKAAPHVLPLISRPFGWVPLLALWQWRRPEARLLVAMACIPYTPAPYELVPLFLIPSTWLEAAILLVLTYVFGLSVPFHLPFQERMIASADALVRIIFAPCTALILWKGLRDRKAAR
jgi:hypothetical protein